MSSMSRSDLDARDASVVALEGAPVRLVFADPSAGAKALAAG